LWPGSSYDVENRMSKITIVHHGFVIPKNKCVDCKFPSNFLENLQLLLLPD
jgi:hypothetical protein